MMEAVSSSKTDGGYQQVRKYAEVLSRYVEVEKDYCDPRYQELKLIIGSELETLRKFLKPEEPFALWAMVTLGQNWRLRSEPEVPVELTQIAETETCTIEWLMS